MNADDLKVRMELGCLFMMTPNILADIESKKDKKGPKSEEDRRAIAKAKAKRERKEKKKAKEERKREEGKRRAMSHFLGK